MKMSKRFKAIMSIVLIITMLLSVAVVGVMGASAASTLSIAYNFKYENAGYAEGRVELKAGSTADYGTYYLYWADNTKALEGYAPITTITLNTSVKYFEFGEFTAIPADATKMIAVKSTATKTVAAAAAVYDIPASKQFKVASSEKQYDFQALSDIHIQFDDSYWVHSKEHFANALEVAAKRDVEFITVCGDAVNGYAYDNLKKEYPMYLKIIADSSFTNPVYETNGNHEMKGGSATQNLDLYRIATGLNTTTNAVSTKPYYEKTINGDHYIFLVLEMSGSPNESSEFTSAQLDWFEGLLKKYDGDGHKIIVNQHALIRGYGAGDDKETPFYGGALLDTYADVRRLMDIMEAYPEMIVLSGHSHIDFKYNYNFDNEDGKTCYTVHIPSTSSTTHPNLSSGKTDYIMSPDSSQGYFVDVYEDYVVFNGTDLVKNEILPLYTYMVDYTGEKLVEKDMPDAPDVDYELVQVEVDVKAISENPGSVKVKLYGADDSTLSKEVTMSKTTAGTYTAKVSTQFTKMKFLVNGGSTGEYTVANCKVVLGGTKIKVDLSSIKTKDGASCTGWTTVNAYAWNQAANQDTGAWPGTAMTKGSDGSYTLLIDSDVNPDMIIFNNGSAQTADLAIAPYVVAKIERSYTLTDGGDITTLPEESTAESTTDTEDDPVEKITIYFVKDSAWPEAYTYGFYGVEGGTATGEPLGEYPGKLMTFVEKDVNGNDIYSCEIPADIDYIKFVDGTATNRRTNNVPAARISANAAYCLGALAEPDKWDVADYAYEPPTQPTETDPVESTVETVAPTQESTDNTTVTDTDPTETTEDTTATDPQLLYGDADLNGIVNVKDATAVQKHAASLITLEGVGFIQANVSGDKAVNVRDATAIQKKVAGLITQFPVEGKAEVALVGATASELTALVAKVKTILSDEHYYASYDAYMALKKAYTTYKSSTNTNTAYTAINDALTTYEKMKKNNPNHVDAASASSGSSLPTGSTTNATSLDGTKTKPTDGAYAIRGSFNNWGNSGLEYMKKNSDGTYSISYELTAGTYSFKFYDADTSAWYGNGSESGMNAGDSNWTFLTSAGNCPMNATVDGVYTFTYRYEESSKKVRISLSVS